MTGWHAQVGDEVSVESHRLRGSRRRGEILEVLGATGSEYYRVRWQDGRESVFHPGSDALLHPRGGSRTRGPEADRRRPRRPPATRKEQSAAPVAEKPRGRPGLRASPGDRLVIKGHHLGEPSRDGEILEVVGPDGAPPFRVRWSETGREALFFPGADAVVEHFPRRRRATRKG